jgi:hypothetical protein
MTTTISGLESIYLSSTTAHLESLFQTILVRVPRCSSLEPSETSLTKYLSKVEADLSELNTFIRPRPRREESESLVGSIVSGLSWALAAYLGQEVGLAGYKWLREWARDEMAQRGYPSKKSN